MGEHFNARDLPWGWWLRAKGYVFEDENGQTWKSVRDAFWEGCLGFPHAHYTPEQLELLLRMLTAIDRRAVTSSKDRDEFFSGYSMFWRFYMSWLVSTGLTAAEPLRSPTEAVLTPKGRSVMLMLQATRDPAWIDLPMQEVIDEVQRAMFHPEHEFRDKALQVSSVRSVLGVTCSRAKSSAGAIS